MKKIKIPIFNQTIHILDENEVKKFLSENCDQYKAIVFKDRKKRLCFYYNTKLSSSDIAHESVHLALDILRSCLIDVNDEEALAYLTGYIFKKLEKEK